MAGVYELQRQGGVINLLNHRPTYKQVCNKLGMCLRVYCQYGSWWVANEMGSTRIVLGCKGEALTPDRATGV